MSDIVRPELATWRPASPRRTGPAIHRHVRLLDAQRDQRIGCRGCCGWGSTSAGRSPTCSCTTPRASRSGSRRPRRRREDQSIGVLEGIRLICAAARASAEPTSTRSCTAPPLRPTRCSKARRARRPAGHRRASEHDPAPRRGVDAGAAVRLDDLREARSDRRHRRTPRGRRSAWTRRARCARRSTSRPRAPRSRICATRGVEAITVSLINFFREPAHHERRSREIAREERAGPPGLAVLRLLPEFREYERTVTTVMNAYVRRCSTAISRASRDRLAAKARGPPPGRALRRRPDERSTRLGGCPVHTVLSGPAGGVNGAAFVARPRRLRPHPHLRHGRHLHRRGASSPAAADHHARDRASASSR